MKEDARAFTSIRQQNSERVMQLSRMWRGLEEFPDEMTVGSLIDELVDIRDQGGVVSRSAQRLLDEIVEDKDHRLLPVADVG